jgi:hypothetical protein
MIPTESHAKEILRLLSFGLVSGLGQQIPGKMCVEAAVCCALGLPHSDNPPCVGAEVRKFKIGLNDKSWGSNQDRANGMKELAIAQLGSNTIDQKLFRDTLWFELGTKIQPIIWRFLAEKGNRQERLELADKMENSVTLEECRAHAHGYAYAHAHAYDYAHAYAHGYAYANSDFLSKVAAVGVSVLKQLNSPGCQWLHLCQEQ